jgi:hypothetical protein
LSLPRRFANRDVGHCDWPQGKSGALSSEMAGGINAVDLED